MKDIETLVSEDTFEDALDIVDKAIKRLVLPGLLFVTAYYLYSGDNSNNLYTNSKLHSYIVALVGVILTFSIFGLSGKKMAQLKMSFKKKIWCLFFYSITFPSLAIVVVAQAVQKITGG